MSTAHPPLGRGGPRGGYSGRTRNCHFFASVPTLDTKYELHNHFLRADLDGD